ncbi:copper chaperone PCu(A)C [Reyranella sp.]|uniref:copper chaperone PCu(A)C n=1 Tax=Reyranella sp. TaxID=1929291 RepID=UPI00260499D7|nr:copper chaperone PCu(A)C [Reyranella sp.]HQS14834.1 copper chaperone PCu(A)C [Reyranella sp.]HQT14221.1 copper chaperone PCu(A)C [Reyranella sp.]
MLKWLRRSEPKEVPAASLGPLQIVKPWARSSSSEADVAGGYMTVVNDGETDRLVSVSCPAAASVDIHAIRVKGPVLEMRPMEAGLVIPPANQQILKPRGYHLLMRGLASPLTVGSKLPVTLVFETAGSVTVDFAVEAPGAVGHATLSSS